ncbi:hypothetical protein GPECTOR_61g847 [Gonium pectorale]|uniref:Septin-type G domain-containing protein n=1 Tax=Gonium pectorale TaxID=33097 RepID=A0A150G4Z6_GONPE|nr:hypothetical protein GPECTOR_61g847 [Gonium pectorale]|eukprot:KXZ44894.1 hypothetical protein GPECTOR_61g847 [Gonium pectorale]
MYQHGLKPAVGLRNAAAPATGAEELLGRKVQAHPLLFNDASCSDDCLSSTASPVLPLGPAQSQPSAQRGPPPPASCCQIDIVVAGGSGLGKSAFIEALVEAYGLSPAPLRRLSSARGWSLPGAPGSPSQQQQQQPPGLTRISTLDRYPSQLSTCLAPLPLPAPAGPGAAGGAAGTLRCSLLDVPGYDGEPSKARHLSKLLEHVLRQREKDYRAAAAAASPAATSATDSEKPAPPQAASLCLYFLPPREYVSSTDLAYMAAISEELPLLPVLALGAGASGGVTGAVSAEQPLAALQASVVAAMRDYTREGRPAPITPLQLGGADAVLALQLGGKVEAGAAGACSPAALLQELLERFLGPAQQASAARTEAFRQRYEAWGGDMMALLSEEFEAHEAALAEAAARDAEADARREREREQSHPPRPESPSTPPRAQHAAGKREREQDAGSAALVAEDAARHAARARASSGGGAGAAVVVPATAAGALGVLPTMLEEHEDEPSDRLIAPAASPLATGLIDDSAAAAAVIAPATSAADQVMSAIEEIVRHLSEEMVDVTALTHPEVSSPAAAAAAAAVVAGGVERKLAAAVATAAVAPPPPAEVAARAAPEAAAALVADADERNGPEGQEVIPGVARRAVTAVLVENSISSLATGATSAVNTAAAVPTPGAAVSDGGAAVDAADAAAATAAAGLESEVEADVVIRVLVERTLAAVVAKAAPPQQAAEEAAPAPAAPVVDTPLAAAASGASGVVRDAMRRAATVVMAAARMGSPAKLFTRSGGAPSATAADAAAVSAADAAVVHSLVKRAVAAAVASAAQPPVDGPAGSAPGAAAPPPAAPSPRHPPPAAVVTRAAASLGA